MAGGRLGDIFGHRNVLIFGMTLFNIATLICALVRNQIGFLIGRAFQGRPPLFVPLHATKNYTDLFQVLLLPSQSRLPSRW